MSERAGSRRGSCTACAKATFVVLSLCASVLIVLCWFSCYGTSAERASVEISRSVSAEPNVVTTKKPSPSKSAVAKTVCELICQGKFSDANELIQKSGQIEQPQLQRLAEIVKEYQSIQERRESSRKAAFKEQLAELEKLKSPAGSDVNDPNVKAGSVASKRPGDANDPNTKAISAASKEPNGEILVDVNNASPVPPVLVVIARASEFADQDQKSQLLADPFVKQTLQDTADKASKLESKGKWLDAYATAFYWLRAIDPNNKGYSEYSDELLEKAGIAVFFQDSPCETRQERYEGVKKDMFVRSVDALSLHYVNSIDYAEMARKSVKRAKLLADVLATAFGQDSQSPKAENAFIPPTHEKLAVWSAAMAALSDQIGQSPEGFGKNEFLGVFDKLLALNTATIELPEPAMIVQLAEAALTPLDPYTVIVWPKQVDDFEKMMTNEFTGIGIEISKSKGLLTVSSLLPDTPAYKSGLDAGDIIEQVDGIPTKDMSLICAVKKITGPKSTKVTLTIKRPDEDKTKLMTITRAKIVVPTVRGWKRDESGKWRYMIDGTDQIGYVRVTSFSGETASDLETVLKQLEAGGLKGLVLDFRLNSGGLLDSAVQVTDKFIREGLIVRTQPKVGLIPTFEMAHKSDTHPDYPLVILIDSGSASASEIVAGALADPKHNRAVLVGERTHGKGSVQGVTHYPGGSAQLKYTMAYYHLPSGQRVKSREEAEKQGKKDWGVAPHVEVELRSDEMKTMIDLQRDNDVLVQAERNQTRPTRNRHTSEETLKADPQLAVAVLVLKTKLIEAGLGSSVK